jgi:hypothetical protein
LRCGPSLQRWPTGRPADLNITNHDPVNRTSSSRA